MTTFFSNRSVRFKLMVMLSAVNLTVLLSIAGGLALQNALPFKGEGVRVAVSWGAFLPLFALVFSMAFLLSLFLQQLISKDIAGLAKSVHKKVFVEGNKALNLKHSKDELVLLSAGFDEILAKLQKKEAALKVSEARYDFAAESSNVGLWDWDLKTDQIYFSPCWQALLGYDLGEIGSEPSEWFDRIYPEDVQAVRKAIAAHINGETPYFEQDFRIQHKKNGCRWVRSRALLLRDEDGSPAHLGGAQSEIALQEDMENRQVSEAA